MTLDELTDRAMSTRRALTAAGAAQGFPEWRRDEVMQGFVGDVGDLMKLVMAKEGRRRGTDVDQKLAHELADCLWSVLVLAKLYGVELEPAFLKTMSEIEAQADRSAS